MELPCWFVIDYVSFNVCHTRPIGWVIYDVSWSQESVCAQTPTMKALVHRDSCIDLAFSLLSHKAISLRPLNPNGGFIRLFSLLNTELKQFHTILETIRPRILIMVGKYSDSMQSLVDKLHFWSLGITLPYKNSNFLQLFLLSVHFNDTLIIEHPTNVFSLNFQTTCWMLCMLFRHV